ncbi:MAG: hypothetical protein K0R57_2634 [Paenibacillaceae bacterium]|nr:hypothetical protein [Paenibacillaceae bacterium]
MDNNQWNNEDSKNNTQEANVNDGSVIPATYGFSPVDGYGQQPPRKKQSGLGIASFTISLAMGALFIVLVVVFIAKIAGTIDLYDTTYNPEDVAAEIENMPELAVIPFLMLGSVIGTLVGLVLGIVGLFQKERKKVFAILGTVFNGLAVATVGFFVLIGLMTLFV